MNKLTQTAKKYMIPFGRYHSFNGLRDEALVQSKYDVIEPQLPHFRMFFFHLLQCLSLVMQTGLGTF